MYCPNCGREVAEGRNFCTGCGAAMNPEMAVQPDETLQPQHPMKWFKFLIYFGLFAGAFVNLINGINLLTGTSYGDMKYLVYRMFKDLKTLDTVVGLLMVGLAVLGVVTRFRLAKFYKNGPKLLTALYVAAAVVGLLYVVGAQTIVSVAIGGGLMDISGQVGSICSSIVMAVVNGIYFKKRSDLFVK